MYSPKIRRDLIPRIYRAAKAARISMAAWVNRSIELDLEAAVKEIESEKTEVTRMKRLFRCPHWCPGQHRKSRCGRVGQCSEDPVYRENQTLWEEVARVHGELYPDDPLAPVRRTDYE